MADVFEIMYNRWDLLNLTLSWQLDFYNLSLLREIDHTTTRKLQSLCV